MKLAWRKTLPSEKSREWSCIVGCACLAGGLVLFSLLWPFTRIPVCLFHRLSGLPCPACGTTRCMHALLRLDPAEAWRVQPLMSTVLPLLALWLLYTALALRWDWPRVHVAGLNRRDRWMLVGAGAVLVLSNWAYLIASGV